MQVRAQIYQTFFPGIRSRVSQGACGFAPTAFEIVDDNTGITLVRRGTWVLDSSNETE